MIQIGANKRIRGEWVQRLLPPYLLRRNNILHNVAGRRISEVERQSYAEQTHRHHPQKSGFGEQPDDPPSRLVTGVASQEKPEDPDSNPKRN